MSLSKYLGLILISFFLIAGASTAFAQTSLPSGSITSHISEEVVYDFQNTAISGEVNDNGWGVEGIEVRITGFNWDGTSIDVTEDATVQFNTPVSANTYNWNIRLNSPGNPCPPTNNCIWPGYGVYTIIARAYKDAGGQREYFSIEDIGNVRFVDQTPFILFKEPRNQEVVSFLPNNFIGDVYHNESITVEASVDNGQFQLVTNVLADRWREWTYLVDSGMLNSQQNHTFTIRVKNSVTGQVLTEESIEFYVNYNPNPTVDTTPPTVNSLNIQNGSAVTLPETITINATDSGNGVQEVKVYKGAFLLGNATQNGNDWEFILDSSNIDEGTYTFLFAVSDGTNAIIRQVDNVTVSHPQDNTPPELTIGIQDNEALPMLPYSITGTIADENPVSIEIEIDGVSQRTLGPFNSTSPTGWIFMLYESALDNSLQTHTITATAEDSENNTSTVTRHFTVPQTPPVQNQAPTVTINQMPNPITQLPYTVTGTLNDDSQVTKLRIILTNNTTNYNLSIDYDNPPANWDFELTSNYTNGDYTLKAIVFDDEGLQKEEEINFSVNHDSEGPVISLVNLNAGDTLQLPRTLSFNAEDLSGVQTVAVLADNSFLGNATCGLMNYCEFDLLSDYFYKSSSGNSHKISIAAKDIHNNITIYEIPNVIIQKPELQRATADLTINLTANQEITQRPYTITGSKTPGITEVKLFSRSSLLGEADLTKNAWSFELNESNGTYLITAKGYNSKGNLVAETNAVKININVPGHSIPDTEPPTLDIINLNPGTTLDSDSFNLEGIFTDNDSGINRAVLRYINRDSGREESANLRLNGGEFTYSLSNLNNGDYLLELLVWDNAGNQANYSFNFQVNLPVYTPGIVINGGNEFTNSSNVEITVNYPNMQPARFNLSCGNQARESERESSFRPGFIEERENTFTVNLEKLGCRIKEGPVTLTVNFQGDPNKYSDTIQLDLTNPTVSITNPTSDQEITSLPFDLVADIEDPAGNSRAGGSGINEVKVFLNDSELNLTPTVQGNTYTYSINESLSNGDHTIKVTAEDNAGNISEETIAFKVNVQSTTPSPPANPPGGGSGGGTFFGGGGGGIPTTQPPQQPEQPEAEEPETGSETPAETEQPEETDSGNDNALPAEDDSAEPEETGDSEDAERQTPTGFFGFGTATGFLNLGPMGDIAIATGLIVLIAIIAYLVLSFISGRRKRKAAQTVIEDIKAQQRL